MREFLKKNIIYVLFATVLVFIFVSFFMTDLIIPKKIPPQPTPFQISKPTTGEKYQIITRENEDQLNKDRAVSALIKKLPYQSPNFYFSYFYSNGEFQLTLYKGREKQGEEEFKLFLKENSIPDRNYLKSLIIKVY